MSLVVREPGLQTLVQAPPRRGLRHLGVPASGAADPLSLALANRLVGNPLAAAGLEVALSGMSLVSTTRCRIAVTGATCRLAIAGKIQSMHRRLDVPADARIELGPAEQGARSYLAVHGGFAGDEILGSTSTYLPARIGGYEGRALAAGDRLDVAGEARDDGAAETPAELRWTPPVTATLRALPAAEYGSLNEAGRRELFRARFEVGGRNDRMGVALEGPRLEPDSSGALDSRPVFPGTVQCPESGQLFLLGVDAQTTGGYARVAEVIRADRLQIGQLRSGMALRFLRRDPDTAANEYRALLGYWSEWLPGVDTLL